MIVKVKKRWRVISERTHKNLGEYTTKLKAIKRLKQVEYFNHKH